MKHGTNNFYNRVILPFNQTILLESVWCCSLPLNANFSIIILGFIGFILGPIICPQYLDFLPGLVFDPGFEMSEPSEHFIILLQEVDPGLTRIIIHKGEII